MGQAELGQAIMRSSQVREAVATFSGSAGCAHSPRAIFYARLSKLPTASRPQTPTVGPPANAWVGESQGTGQREGVILLPGGSRKVCNNTQ